MSLCSSVQTSFARLWMTWWTSMAYSLPRRPGCPVLCTLLCRQSTLSRSIWRIRVSSAVSGCTRLSFWHQVKDEGCLEGWRSIRLCPPKVVLVSGVGEYEAGGVEVTPTVVAVGQGSRFVEFDVLNRCTRHMRVPSGVLMATLMQVTIQDIEVVEKMVAEDDKFFGLFGEDFDRTSLPQWLLRCMKRNADTFSQTDLDLGRTAATRHSMTLFDYLPFKEKARRVPPHMYEEVRQHLRSMLDFDVIRPSNSPWTSNVVLVRKPTGELRFCIYLRRINQRSVSDAYYLPRIDETLDALARAKIFTSLDLKIRILAGGARRRRQTVHSLHRWTPRVF